MPTPPVRLVDNPATWLGFTDLVFVDPVGTGFSRGKGKEENPDKPFWDVRADIASLGCGDPALADPPSALDIAGVSWSARAMAGSAPRRWRRACRAMSTCSVSGLVLVSPALDLSALHQTERDLLAAGVCPALLRRDRAAYERQSTLARPSALRSRTTWSVLPN